MQKKHIVGIEVRADAAAIGRIRNHQVVETRVRHETETVEQRARAVVLQIHALHEQCPCALFDGRQFVGRERAVLQLPFVAEVRDQARFDVVPIGQLEQLVARQRRFDVRNRLTDQQRLFLPVAAHELRRAQMAEKCGRNVGRGRKNGPRGRLCSRRRIACRTCIGREVGGPPGHRIM
ncbi:hypothetical protein OKW37_003304 [Paraburkholderia sp. MM5482-R2]